MTTIYPNTAQVWETNTGKSVAELRGHTGNVISAMFSPSSSFVVTANYPDTARVWETSTGRSVAELRGHTGNVLSTAFSRDGQRIVTVSLDKTGRLTVAMLDVVFQRAKEFAT